jgi:hypothetical protein
MKPILIKPGLINYEMFIKEKDYFDKPKIDSIFKEFPKSKIKMFKEGKVILNETLYKMEDFQYKETSKRILILDFENSQDFLFF